MAAWNEIVHDTDDGLWEFLQPQAEGKEYEDKFKLEKKKTTLPYITLEPKDSWWESVETHLQNLQEFPKKLEAYLKKKFPKVKVDFEEVIRFSFINNPWHQNTLVDGGAKQLEDVLEGTFDALKYNIPYKIVEDIAAIMRGQTRLQNIPDSYQTVERVPFIIAKIYASKIEETVPDFEIHWLNYYANPSRISSYEVSLVKEFNSWYSRLKDQAKMQIYCDKPWTREDFIFHYAPTEENTYEYDTPSEDTVAEGFRFSKLGKDGRIGSFYNVGEEGPKVVGDFTYSSAKGDINNPPTQFDKIRSPHDQLIFGVRNPKDSINYIKPHDIDDNEDYIFQRWTTDPKTAHIQRIKGRPPVIAAPSVDITHQWHFKGSGLKRLQEALNNGTLTREQVREALHKIIDSDRRLKSGIRST